MVDTVDLKSIALKGVPVRVRPEVLSQAFFAEAIGASNSQFLAGLDVQFAGGEEWDFANWDDDLRAPEGGEAFVEELVAEVDAFLLKGVAGDSGEQDDGFAFFLIRDADDGDLAFGLAIEAEDFVDGSLDGFVGNHFPGDFRETRDATLDVEEAVFVEVTDVAGLEPTVFGEDFLGAFFIAEVTGKMFAPLRMMMPGLPRGTVFSVAASMSLMAMPGRR